MKVLLCVGEYQYGDRSRGAGTEYSAFVPALRRLGAEVYHFESWDRSKYADFAALNREFTKAVAEIAPDVVLIVPFLYEIWLETLESIRARTGAALVCWTTDDSWKYIESSRYLGTAVHAMTTTYDYVVSQYHRDGIQNVLLTQWAADATNLADPLPARECRYPVSFVGSAYGDRKRQIKRLRKLGINVECFGQGWPNGPVSAEDIPRIVQNSFISLNFANSKGSKQIKARVFEVPGAGGFLLTENAPGLERYFSCGIEIETFETLEQLARKIPYYLNNPQLRDAIARAGHVRVRQEHTYDIRLKEVLEFAADARAAWRLGHPNVVAPNLTHAEKAHELTPILRTLRSILISACSLIVGRKRAPRAARRLIFELSWRFAGRRTYTASGLPGRLFYAES
jgi:spore maturation protein CgeB